MALRSLSHDGVDLPPHAFDVRGWEARTEPDDAAAGSVEDLLLDGEGTPRHLVVALRDGDMGRLLVPLSRAWADASRKAVWISGLDQESLRRMPRYEGDPAAVSPETEARLLQEYAHGSRAGVPGSARWAAGGARPLARLADLEELRVAKGSTDPRGWTVLGGDGQKVGEVAELIVDRESMNARYLDCDVDEERLELERLDRHVLFPVDRVRLDHEQRHVVVEGLFGRDLARYPVYTGLPLSHDAEADIAGWFGGSSAAESKAPAWAEPAARRFFAGRRRSGPGDESPRRERGGRGEARGEDQVERAGGGAVRVRLPEEGEVRVRVSGDDVLIERSGEEGSRDG